MKFTLKTFVFLLFIAVFTNSCTKKQDYFHHIIMIEYTQHANMDEVILEVLGFKDIPSVLDLSFGKIEKNQKNKIQNFTYCLSLTFKDRKAMDSYLMHPYHQKIYKKHQPLIAAVYTADFNAISLKK